ncbi:MAG: hypothetical protein JWL76_1204 [Thermoleophilia bacterium]|nr:hypothetical protein [Thermoleophilia bacterium]
MTLLRIEVHAPDAQAQRAAELLAVAPHAINVTRQRGVLIDPPGDLVSCDVPREVANGVVESLHEAGFCSGDSNVTLIGDLTHLSERADTAELAASGSASDALIWRQLRDLLDEELTPTVTFLLFMVLATMLGAIGVVTNSAILVVGAMVIGPEFGPLAALFVAVLDGRWRAAARGALTLVVGFAIAIAAASLFTLALDATGAFPDRLEFAGFVKEVATPTTLSFVIALVAGVAGTLAITSSRSGSLIGVLISVTTIPAAADAAALLAYGREREAVDAMLTLAINLTGMTLAGVLSLAVHRRLTRAATT